MKKLFAALIAELESGRDAVLCSILASSGSSPRGAGSTMLVLASGETLGTIGGGGVELTAARQAAEVLRARQSLVKGYCLTRNEVSDVGMICGGDVTVYFQWFSHEDARALAVLRRAEALLNADGNAWLIRRIRDDAVAALSVYDAAGGLFGLDGAYFAELKPLLQARAVYLKGEWYVEPIARAGRVYIFGGGHVGQALAPVLSGVGFRVTVYDNRERMAGQFPTAERFILGDYGDVGAHVALTSDDYAVIMSPGHQADYELLTQVLRSPATYIGCIGSRHKVAATTARLLADGFAEADAARIHSPIGLAIGAETPAEIAISVAAELIAHRAGLR